MKKEIALGLLIVLIAMVFGVYFYLRPKGMELNFSLPKTTFYNFSPVKFNYTLINKDNKDRQIVLRMSVCNNQKCVLGQEKGRPVWKKMVEVKAGQKLTEEEVFIDEEKMDWGEKILLLEAWELNQKLGQKSIIVKEKSLAEDLYLNLDLNRQIVIEEDYTKLSYTFINKTNTALKKDNYVLTLNFAGPLELFQNSGKLIKDVSQDILAGQRVDNEEFWVAKEYPHRMGGDFNVSLLLSIREKDGSLTPVTSVVRRVKWL